MFDSAKQNFQLSFPFECDSCLYKQIGRCSGPVDYNSYVMESPELVPCVNVDRRQQLFNDLYGRMPPIPESSNQEWINLPPFIPCVTDGMENTLTFKRNALFAVSLETLIGRRGNLNCTSISDLRHKLCLPDDSKLALIGTAKDWRIERLWTVSDKYRIWQQIADFGFEFVTSLTYSVYDEHPRANHIYNQDRNFVTHDLLANLGVSSIPFLYPYNDEDYKDAFQWLENRPDISKIAVLAQFYKTPKQFEQFLTNMQKIQDGVRRPLEFLVVGVAKPDRITAVMRNFTASIVSSKPFHKALSGFRTLDDLSHPKDDKERHNLSRSQLATKNIEQFERFCENCKSISSVVQR